MKLALPEMKTEYKVLTDFLHNTVAFRYLTLAFHIFQHSNRTKVS